MVSPDIFSHNQVHVISKNVHCFISFSSSFVKYIFFTLTAKFWHFLWLSVCTLSHLVSSVIEHHLYASAMLISTKNIKCSLFKCKRYINIYDTKNWQNWKKKSPLIRASMPVVLWNFTIKYLISQNVWAGIWNRYNSMNLVIVPSVWMRSFDLST